MALNVGRIPFLVCAPFFHDFLGREQECSGVNFFDGTPSEHSKGLMDGFIHLSPASSITFAQKPAAFVLSPSLCTSCSFEVRSVRLFSRYPIEELTGKVVQLTAQSKTSITLLKILLQERFRVKPNYAQGVATVPDAAVPDAVASNGGAFNGDACLLIGDQALEEGGKNRFPYSYDLGTLWQDWQGLPFVFGAWIIHKSALDPQNRPLLEKYLEATEKSIESFRKSPNTALDRWLARYPVNLDKEIILDYYKIIDYHFTDERKKSLGVFFGYAQKLGMIPQAPALEFL